MRLGESGKAPELHDLTFYQNRFWQMEQAFPGTSGYVLSALLKSPVFDDARLLDEAVRLMVRDNDATRLRIVTVPGGVKQYVRDDVDARLDFFDLSQEPGALTDWIRRTAPTPFPLEDADLFHAAVLQTGAREYGVFFKAHHLIGDEWSSRLLARQVHDNYVKLRNGEDVSGRVRYSYLDYVRSEESYMRSERFSKHGAYWEDRFGDLPASLVARSSTPPDPSRKTTGFQVHQLPLGSSTSVLEQEQVSLLCLSLAAFARYFKTVKHEDELVFGLPTHNRLTHQERNTLGMFANSVLLRVTMDDQTDHRSIVGNVRRELHYVLKNQRYPYPLLKQFIEERYGFKGHLYRTYVSFAQEDERDYEVESFINHTQYCPLIVRIYHQVARNNLMFHFYYWQEDYSAEDIERLFGFVGDQLRSLASAG